MKKGCDECDEMFENPKDLRKHKADHKKTCHLCGKILSTIQNLNNHLTKSYPCDLKCRICDKQSETRNAHDYHMRAVHPNNKAEKQNKNLAPIITINNNINNNITNIAGDQNVYMTYGIDPNNMYLKKRTKEMVMAIGCQKDGTNRRQFDFGTIGLTTVKQLCEDNSFFKRNVGGNVDQKVVLYENEKPVPYTLFDARSKIEGLVKTLLSTCLDTGYKACKPVTIKSTVKYKATKDSKETEKVIVMPCLLFKSMTDDSDEHLDDEKKWKGIVDVIIYDGHRFDDGVERYEKNSNQDIYTRIKTNRDIVTTIDPLATGDDVADEWMKEFIKRVEDKIDIVMMDISKLVITELKIEDMLRVTNTMCRRNNAERVNSVFTKLLEKEEAAKRNGQVQESTDICRTDPNITYSASLSKDEKEQMLIRILTEDGITTEIKENQLRFMKAALKDPWSKKMIGGLHYELLQKNAELFNILSKSMDSKTAMNELPGLWKFAQQTPTYRYHIWKE